MVCMIRVLPFLNTEKVGEEVLSHSPMMMRKISSSGGGRIEAGELGLRRPVGLLLLLLDEEQKI